MIDEIQHAIDGWQQIQGTDRGRAMQPERADYWIERDVVPILHVLSRRSGFVRHATWSLQALAEGSRSSERAAIEAVDGGIREAARALLRVLRRRDVNAAIRRRHPRLTELERERSAGRQWSGSLTIDGQNEVTELEELNRATREMFASLPFDAGSEADLLDYIAGRPWRDLVSGCDYFGPAAELNLVNCGDGAPSAGQPQLGEFLPYCRPSLQQPEDFVVRCLDIRVEHWSTELRRSSVRIDGAIGDDFDISHRHRRDLREAFRQLSIDVRRLRTLTVESPEVAARRAACTLTQVFAAYRPSADLSWLGDAAQLSAGATAIRSGIQSGRDQATPSAIVAALREAIRLFQTSTEVEEEILAAVQGGGLVVVDGGDLRRDVYWEGRWVAGRWMQKERAWRFLCELTRRAATGQSGVTEASWRDSKPRNARYDLKSMVPDSLYALMTRGPVYQLAIPQGQAAYIRLVSEERIPTS